jgi:hypothetical protein
LNILATKPALLAKLAKGRTVVLTPHPGEMARLAGLSVPEVQANRLEVARSFAKKFGVTLVLKGARTLIAHPDGQVAINTTGNPGMAKGGSGDLLTGLVAGLLAQFPTQANQAIEAAVYLHGLAPTASNNFLGLFALIREGGTGMFGCRGCRLTPALLRALTLCALTRSDPARLQIDERRSSRSQASAAGCQDA